LSHSLKAMAPTFSNFRREVNQADPGSAEGSVS
jgi:hypothetical protein